MRCEAGPRDCGAVRSAIMERDDLDILVAMSAVELLILDPQVGEVHLVVEVRQVVFECPRLDLSYVPVRVAV